MRKIANWAFNFSFIVFLLSSLTATAENEKPYVMAELFGQLGNNLFQVATASALAWDNGAEPVFPTLVTVPTLYQHVFHKFKSTPPINDITFEWNEPGFDYHQIPYHPNMKIKGYFQSYKYFAHYREKLLQMFSPNKNDWRYIERKYGWLIEHPETVGVQLRNYKKEDPNQEYYKQCGKEYLEEAMSLFPDTTLFIVSTNDPEFAKQSIPSWVKNVYFFENEKFYIEFFLLSYCKHNIISNSSFGWWGAWLNQNPNKVVVRPKSWINSFPTQDVCPDEWIVIDVD